MDIHIESATNVTITPVVGQRYQLPNILMQSPHFRAGFAKGFQSVLLGEVKSGPMSDEVIVDSIRTMFEEGTPEPDELELALGNLLGEVLARS